MCTCGFSKYIIIWTIGQDSTGIYDLYPCSVVSLKNPQEHLKLANFLEFRLFMFGAQASLANFTAGNEPSNVPCGFVFLMILQYRTYAIV